MRGVLATSWGRVRRYVTYVARTSGVGPPRPSSALFVTESNMGNPYFCVRRTRSARQVNDFFTPRPLRVRVCGSAYVTVRDEIKYGKPVRGGRPEVARTPLRRRARPRSATPRREGEDPQVGWREPAWVGHLAARAPRSPWRGASRVWRPWPVCGEPSRRSTRTIEQHLSVRKPRDGVRPTSTNFYCSEAGVARTPVDLLSDRCRNIRRRA